MDTIWPARLAEAEAAVTGEDAQVRANLAAPDTPAGMTYVDMQAIRWALADRVSFRSLWMEGTAESESIWSLIRAVTAYFHKHGVPMPKTRWVP